MAFQKGCTNHQVMGCSFFHQSLVVTPEDGREAQRGIWILVPSLTSRVILVCHSAVDFWVLILYLYIQIICISTSPFQPPPSSPSFISPPLLPLLHNPPNTISAVYTRMGVRPFIGARAIYHGPIAEENGTSLHQHPSPTKSSSVRGRVSRASHLPTLACWLAPPCAGLCMYLPLL